MKTKDKKLITLAAFARELGKSRQYVDKLKGQGKLVMFGKKVDKVRSLELLAEVQHPGRSGDNGKKKMLIELANHIQTIFGKKYAGRLILKKSRLLRRGRNLSRPANSKRNLRRPL